MDKKRAPGIYLLTDTGNPVEIILTWMDGQETHLPRQSPAEALVDFVGFDFGDYRSQVEELWEEHCVFEERDEVPYADYEDFAAQAVPLAEQLHAAAPAAYWDVQHRVALAEEMTDDGEPIFASRKAFAVLTALRRPYFLQNRMRWMNIESGLIWWSLLFAAGTGKKRPTRNFVFWITTTMWPKTP